MKILLVEDNRALSEWLSRTLEADGYTVERVLDGADADLLLRTESYGLVILDLDLPGLNGREVLKRLRARRNAVPVLILTASGGARERVEGLDFGADDYVVKPFEVSELEARMRALLRRANRQENPRVACASLSYDSNSREFLLAGEPLSLTRRERAVLEMLILKAGKTVGKKALADGLFSLDDEASPDAVEIYVHRIRKKLEASDVVIVTLRGLGYLLEPRHEP